MERLPESSHHPWHLWLLLYQRKTEASGLVDMWSRNEAMWMCDLIPTVEDIGFELNGAQHFSKLDLSQAYYLL